jgi:hypothetical protein
MGLDMMAYSRAKATSKNTRELSAWRKHPNLHGFMEKLWRAKTGNTEEQFNCVELELTLEDLELLENAVLMRDLPETHGFFFGGPADEYYKDQDLAFIAEARGDIAGGRKVYYNSWW